MTLSEKVSTVRVMTSAVEANRFDASRRANMATVRQFDLPILCEKLRGVFRLLKVWV